MALHFIVAGVLGVVLGLCRPFNPDNSRLCARLYAWPAMCILRLRVKADVGPLMDKPDSCVIIANHQSNYDLFVFGNVVPRRTVWLETGAWPTILPPSGAAFDIAPGQGPHLRPWPV